MMFVLFLGPLNLFLALYQAHLVQTTFAATDDDNEIDNLPDCCG